MVGKFEIAVDVREIIREKRTGLSRAAIPFLKSLSKRGISAIFISDEKTDTEYIKNIFSGMADFEFAYVKSRGVLYDQIDIPLKILGKTRKFFSVYPKFPVLLPLLGVETHIMVADLINFSPSQLLFLKVFGKLPKEIIAISDFWREKVEKLMSRPVKKVYVYTSYLIDDEHQSHPNQKNIILDDLPEKFVLYVGNFNPHKNVRTLIRAFELIRDEVDFHLVLAGGGGKNPEDIKEGEKIKIIRFPSDHLIKKLYKRCIFFVFPSLVEGLGVPPLEACYYGKAVICSDIPVFRETMGSCAVFFDPKSPKDLAQKMLLLYRNEKLRREVEIKCEKVGKEFASHDSGEEIFKIIFGQ